MSTATRPSSSLDRYRPGRVVGAFLRRDLSIVRSYRFPFVLDTLFGVLQLAIFFFLSKTFEGAGPQGLDGAPSYFAFAAVGMVIALVIEAAAEGISERVREEQLSGSLEALLVQPINAASLCAGLAAFPFAFAQIRALVYLLIAAVLMGLDLSETSWIGFTAIFVTSAFALAGLGIVAAAAVLVFKRGQVISGLAIFGMTLITGAVFPVSALPDWLARLGSVLPLRFSFDGARDALFQGSGWETDALALGGYTLVGIPIAVLLFAKALDATRRAGSLGQY